MFVIFHHRDPDGFASAAIMLAWWKDRQELSPVKCVEINYDDPVDFSMIQPGDVVAVVDFSFKPKDMAALRKKAAKVIWCDHHVTAQAYGYDDLPGVRDFLLKGMAGCECTWKFCFPDREVPRAIKLLGDYDAWRLEYPEESLPFYEGLKLNELSPMQEIWPPLLHGTARLMINDLIEQGSCAIRYRNAYCDRVQKSYGYPTTLDGHSAYAVNLSGFGSPGFGAKMKLYPVCISYIYDGRQYTVTLYSNQVDVSQIAQQHGGGGHKGAAGFTCTKLPFERLS